MGDKKVAKKWMILSCVLIVVAAFSPRATAEQEDADPAILTLERIFTEGL